ncbi:hypothetical protein ACIRBX_02085 [Kitasatospora sp. NPDC096147]|uniref:hypothetical protein n=1 Tax=Kitasatospora sp. NPDC096147 TaxID=3364093 RepID=UPI0037F57F51
MADQEPHNQPQPAGSRRRQLIASLVSLGALGIGVLHTVRPELKVDAVTVVLAVVAVVPWLGELFESIELPGGTKLQYRQLQERVEAVELQAAQARSVGDDASRQARVALAAAGGEGVRGGTELAALIAEFTDLRRREPSGPARTYQQEQIFVELARITPGLDAFDPATALRSTDAGVRLAAYARLYAKPELEYWPELVEAALAEPLGFSQYWAIHAINALITVSGVGHVRLDAARRLRALLPQLPPGGDRHGVLRTVLGRMERALG